MKNEQTIPLEWLNYSFLPDARAIWKLSAEADVIETFENAVELDCHLIGHPKQRWRRSNGFKMGELARGRKGAEKSLELENSIDLMDERKNKIVT